MRLVLSILCASALLFAACDSGSSSSSSTPTADATEDASSADVAGADATSTDTTADDTAATDDTMVEGDTAAWPAEGACTNDADMALDLADVGAQTSTIATDCYLGGATDDEAYFQCATEGLIAATGVSEGCADCYVQNALCAKNNCLVPCLSDPDACTECRDENGCTDAFYMCTGDITQE